MAKRERREKERSFKPEDIDLSWIKDVDKVKPKKGRRR